MAQYLSCEPVNSSINRLAQLEGQTTDQSGQGSSPRIKVQPRVVFEDRLIMQRKSWLIPKESLPVVGGKESEWLCFQKMNEWRLSLGIPDEVFIHLSPRRGGSADIKPEETRRLGRDDHKPQYINFTNPFLTNLFKKMIAKATGTLKIEEMLPNSKQLITLSDKRYVTEFVIQWYSSEGCSHE